MQRRARGHTSPKLKALKLSPTAPNRVASLSRDYLAVDAYSNLQTFAEEQLMRTGRRFFVVTLNGRPEGIITLAEIAAVPRARWPYTTVADVMRSLDRVHAVRVDTRLSCWLVRI